MLLRKADNMLSGTELTLGHTHYIGGRRVVPPRLEVPEDYTDTDYIDVEGTIHPVASLGYSYLKDYVVKLRYTPEDQIAILCNRELDGENDKYRRMYDEMQAWRKVAAGVAAKYSAKEVRGDNQ